MTRNETLQAFATELARNCIELFDKLAVYDDKPAEPAVFATLEYDPDGSPASFAPSTSAAAIHAHSSAPAAQPVMQAAAPQKPKTLAEVNKAARAAYSAVYRDNINAILTAALAGEKLGEISVCDLLVMITQRDGLSVSQISGLTGLSQITSKRIKYGQGVGSGSSLSALIAFGHSPEELRAITKSLRA